MSDTPDTRLDALLARMEREVAPAKELWPDIEARAAKGQIGHHRAWLLAAGIAAVAIVATFDLRVWDRPVSTEAQLERAYRPQLDQLAPDTRRQIDHDLDVIRNARQEIRRALASDPANPLLNELMATTWQQEIDLYRDVAANSTG